MATQAELAYEALVILLRHSQAMDAPAKPLLWLGAGASAYDGVPVGDALLVGLVGSTGKWGSPQYRLDRLFEGLPPAARLRLLKPLLDKPLKPDSPYHSVVKLLRKGYFGGAVTFNVDHLIDEAIASASAFSDMEVIDGVEMVPGAISERFFGSTRTSPIVLKLHGGLTTGLNLFTSTEISAYTPKLAEIVESLSRRPAVVCGYSFAHLNVLRSFSTDIGAFFYCNPFTPSAPALLSLMESRGGVYGKTVDGTDGRFETLMAALARDLP